MTSKLVLRELSRYEIGTYGEVIYRNALIYADREAFIYGSERVTFAQFNARANSLIQGLWSMGVSTANAKLLVRSRSLDFKDISNAPKRQSCCISDHEQHVFYALLPELLLC